MFWAVVRTKEAFLGRRTGLCEIEMCIFHTFLKFRGIKDHFIVEKSAD